MSVFEIYLVRIFWHLDRIRRDAAYLSVFSPNARLVFGLLNLGFTDWRNPTILVYPNARKYGPEKLRIQPLFTECITAWKCPYSELLWPIFSRIRTEYSDLSVSSANAGNYGPEKLRIQTLSTQYIFLINWASTNIFRRHIQNSVEHVRRNFLQK